VESVFGQIKNRGFRRFGLRGLKKVNIEFGLVAIAHNMLKWWAVTANIERNYFNPLSFTG